jgi:hypothetical protein
VRAFCANIKKLLVPIDIHAFVGFAQRRLKPITANIAQGSKVKVLAALSGSQEMPNDGAGSVDKLAARCHTRIGAGWRAWTFPLPLLLEFQRGFGGLTRIRQLDVVREAQSTVLRLKRAQECKG